MGNHQNSKLCGTAVKYILSDQQGSLVAVLNSNGTLVSNIEQRYLPFGGIRSDAGQRNNTYIKLIDYKARMYDQLMWVI